MWRTWLLCTAIVALPATVDAQEQHTQEKPKPAGTELRIHVTGGDEAGPVKGATVYLEWKADGETRRREGITNAEGFAGPYRLPRVTVFVQITTSDDVWETYGEDHELTKEQQTIPVTLKKKQSTFCRLDWSWTRAASHWPWAFVTTAAQDSCREIDLAVQPHVC